MNRMTDRCKNITLATTSLRLVKIDLLGIRACLDVPSPCPCPSNLHCMNGDGPFDRQNGFQTQSGPFPLAQC